MKAADKKPIKPLITRYYAKPTNQQTNKPTNQQTNKTIILGN